MSRLSRAITVLVGVAGAAALVAFAPVTEAQDAVPAKKKARPAPAVPANAGGPNVKEGEFTDALTLPTDRKARKALERAQDLLDESNWSDAAHVAQLLLNSKEDMFVEVKRPGPDGKEHTQWTSIRFEANRLLGTMPPNGLQVYELQFGGKARDLLAEARKSPDQRASDELKTKSAVEILADVAQRFLHTKAGSEAAELLGTYYLDRGQPVMATLCFERLLASKGATLSPQVLLKASLAFRFMGDEANANLAWQRLAKAFPAGVRLGDRTVALEDLRKEAARLQKGDALLSIYDWTMFKGNPSRSAQGIGGTPFLDEEDNRWEQPTITGSRVKSLIDTAVNYQEGQQQAIIPAFFPIAAAGKLVFRNYQGVQAVDIRTGKLVWEQVASWSAETVLNDNTYGAIANQMLTNYTQPTSNILNVLYENSTLGTLSTDNNLVFAVDDLAIPPPPQFMQQAMAWGGRANFSRLDEPVNCNQLMAIELDSGKLKWQVGGKGDPAKVDKDPLQECYFLGPPLPLGGKLYVLTEKNAELRLLCLDPATGNLVWSQTLAGVRDRLATDITRRIQAVNLAYSDGILVCPTNAGAIIGVDLLTHSLAWAKPYRETPTVVETIGANGRIIRNGFGALQMAQMRRINTDWKCSSPIIQDGKVVFTAPDGASVYCLNLRDGSTHWKAPRGDDLYLAGVFDGKVLLVGKQSCRALSLADGNKQLWTSEVGLPSGYGTASNKIYYLPLKSPAQGKEPEVCSIDIDTGRIIGHAKSIKKHVPGNLVFYEGRVISQTVDKVAAYPLLSLKLAEMSERIKKNPRDPIGLTERAEMRRHNGEIASAVEDLHVALANRPDQKTSIKARGLLYESLTDLFQKDFNASEKYLQEYQEMCTVPVPADATGEAKQQAEDEQQRRQANFLCLVAKGKESQGKLLEAFQYYRDFGSLRNRTGLLTVIDEPSVKAAPDLWAQGRIAGMMVKATEAQRKPLEDEIANQWRDLRDTNDAARLRSFVTLFGSFSTFGKEARLRLAERLMEEDAFIDAELQALQVYRQENVPLAARAVELLARLCTRKGLLEDAAYWYRLLGRDYAQVPIRDGKTGGDFYNDLATDKRFLPYLDEAPPLWSRGKIKVRQENAHSNMADQTFLFEPEGQLLPFHQRNRLGLASSSFKLRLVNRATGEERWSHAVPRQQSWLNSLNQAQYNPAARGARHSYYVQGHLGVFTVANNVYGIDLSEPKILWERNISPADGGAYVPDPQGGVNVVYTDNRIEKLGQTGPVEPAFVCIHSRQGLTVLDPRQGTVLWTRNDVPGKSVVFGDREHLYILDIGPNGTPGNGRAVRAHDGVSVTVPDFADAYKNKLAIVGRNLLVLDSAPTGEPGAARHRRLRFYDIQAGKDLWQKELAANAVVLQSDDPDLTAIVEPSQNGRLTVIDLRTHKEILHANLDAKDLTGVRSGHLLRDQNLVYVALNAQNNAAQAANGLIIGNAALPNFSPQSGLRGLMLNGMLYAFDRGNGKLKWKNDIKNMALILEQYQDLPVLLFSARFNRVVNNINGAFAWQSGAKSIEKRTGKLLYENEFGQQQPFFHTVHLNTREGTIDLVGTTLKIQHYIETR